jgi:hypothetical protein
MFATSGLDDASLLIVPSLGRPAIVAVRIGRGVVRIPVARRAIAVVRIAAKAQALRHLHLSTHVSCFRGRGPDAGLGRTPWDFGRKGK